MKKLLAILLLGACAVPAAATPGLTLSTWYNTPFYDYYPNSGTIDAMQAYTAGTTADSVETVAVDPYFYANYGSGYTAYSYDGFLNVAIAGAYTFSIYADDAARVTIDGQTVAESNFQGGGLNSPDQVTLNLTAGSHAYSTFYFQEVGGAYLYDYIDGADGLTFSTDTADVPEPAMLGLFGLGAIGLGLSRRRRAA